MGIHRDMEKFLDYVGNSTRGWLQEAGITPESIGDEYPDALRCPHVLAECKRRVNPVQLEMEIAATGDAMGLMAGLSLFCGAANWQQCGRQILQITPELATALSLTSAPEGIPRNLPFDAFVVHLPETPIFYDDDCDGKHPVTGILVTVNNFLFQDLMATRAGPPKERVDLFPLNRSVFNVHRGSRGANTHIHGTWKPGKPYENSYLREDNMQEDDMSALAMMFRLVANLAIYVSERVEAGERVGHRKNKSKKASASVTKYGSAITLPPELVEYCRTGNKDPAFHLRSRFAVRGHWRNQPCGPGRTETKRTWIKPHWKGPEGGEQLRRMYQVEQRDA